MARRLLQPVTAFRVLAAYDPERANQLEGEFRRTPAAAMVALRETLAEALFEVGEDEAAMAVLCS